MDGQPKNPVTQGDKSRIMSKQSEKYADGNIPKDSFPARVQAAADSLTDTPPLDGLINSGSSQNETTPKYIYQHKLYKRLT